MSILESFIRPLYLLLLVLAVPLILYLCRNSLAGLSTTRRYTSIALRLAVVVALILALAQFRIVWKNDRLAVVFLVDRSASVPAKHQDEVVDFMKQAAESRDKARGDAVGVVSFGHGAGIERAPRPRRLHPDFGFSTILKKDYTDIQGGLRLALASFPDGYAKRIVLISDGNENQGEVLDEARAAVSEGASIDTLSVRYVYGGEVLIDKLVVDPEAHVGEPYEIRIIVESTRQTRATLRLFENQQLVYSEEIDLEIGKNPFRMTRKHDTADLYYYHAVVEPITGGNDAILHNNSATAFTFISGQPKVLLCTDDPAREQPLVDALRAERINLVTVRPSGLPSDPTKYLLYDALILSNVASHELTRSQMVMIDKLVKGTGLGLVMVGGENSFGAGGYQGTPIETALPVTMDAKQKKKIPNGALAIVMHSCEIGNGNMWAKKTVQQAIKVLSPQDWAGVIYYDWQGGDRWLFPMMRCTNKQLMLNRLKGFAPADMPSFAGIVKEALKKLTAVPAAIKHIIIFSDGDPRPPTAQTMQQIVANKITLSTICMGSHSRPVVMEQLAKDGGGNFYKLTDPKKLPEIFIREASTVRKALIQERTFLPVVRRGDAFLTGIDLEALAEAVPLHGYVITSEKDQADHYLSAPPEEEGEGLDPLLSSWYYGLGKSVAFTSDSGRRWAADMAGWDNYRKFWAQTIRWVSVSRSDDNLRVTHRREGDKGIVFLDAIDENGEFINGMEFDGTAITPDNREPIPIEVRQIGPGRYRGEFPLGEKGVYLTSFKYERDGRGKVFSTGMTVPYSPEFRKLETNDALLERVAEVTGGKLLDAAYEEGTIFQEIFRGGYAASKAPQDLWRTLLFLAAILFFLDVFVRRVMVDYAEVARKAWAGAVALVRRAPREAKSDERLAALLKRKADVHKAQEPRQFYAEKLADAKKGQRGETSAPAFDAKFDAAASPGKAPPPRRAASAEPKKKPAVVEKSQDDGYTSRLLAAKKRALRKPDDDKKKNS